MKKRNPFLRIFLAVLLITALVPNSAFAESEPAGSEIQTENEAAEQGGEGILLEPTSEPSGTTDSSNVGGSESAKDNLESDIQASDVLFSPAAIGTNTYWTYLNAEADCAPLVIWNSYSAGQLSEQIKLIALKSSSKTSFEWLYSGELINNASVGVVSPKVENSVSSITGESHKSSYRFGLVSGEENTFGIKTPLYSDVKLGLVDARTISFEPADESLIAGTDYAVILSGAENIVTGPWGGQSVSDSLSSIQVAPEASFTFDVATMGWVPLITTGSTVLEGALVEGTTGTYRYTLAASQITGDMTLTINKPQTIVTLTATITGQGSLSVAGQSGSGTLSLIQADSYTFVATPASGYYLSSIKVNGVDQTDQFVFDARTATHNFAHAEVFNVDEPVVELVFESAALMAKAVPDSVTYNDGYTSKTDGTLAKAIAQAVLDGQASLPQFDEAKIAQLIQDGQLKVAYQKGILSTSWEENLNYSPTGFDLLRYRAFGDTTLIQNKQEQVRVTYLGDDRYNGSSITAVINLKQAGLKLKSPLDSVNYIDGYTSKDASLAKEIVLATTDLQGSLPSFASESDVENALAAGQLKVHYAADLAKEGFEALGQNTWKELSYTTSDISLYHPFGTPIATDNYAFKEKVRISYTGSVDAPPSSITAVITLVDGRLETTVSFVDSPTVVYNADVDAVKQQVFEDVIKGVYDLEGNALEGLTRDSFTITFAKELTTSGYVENWNAGTRSVTVTFKGNATHLTSSLTQNITIEKAPVVLDIRSKNLTYDGAQHGVDIITNPEGVSTLSVYAGVDASGSGYLSIVLPEINDPILGPLVNSAIERIAAEGVSLRNLSSTLMPLLELVSSDDAQALEALNQIIAVLPDMALDTTVYINKKPVNAGVYVAFAMTADPNYKTDLDVGSVVIKQDGENVELRFNTDEGAAFFISLEEFDDFDFGARLYKDDIEKQSGTIYSVFAGTSFAGDIVLDTSPSNVPGVYGQTTIVLGGNYKAEPIARLYTVQRDFTTVTLNDGSFTYNGLGQSLSPSFTSPVLSPEGFEPTGAVTHLYFDFLIPTTRMPVNVGEYQQVSTYLGDSLHSSGVSRCATLAITPYATTALPDNKEIVYGEQLSPSDLTYRFSGNERMVSLASSQVTLEYGVQDASGSFIQDTSQLLPGTYTIAKKTFSQSTRNFTVDVSPTAVLTVVKQAQAAPVGLVGHDETVIGHFDGKISGVTDAMEWLLVLNDNSDDTWVPIDPSSTELTGLAPGEFKVRFAETQTSFASPAVTVVIGEGEPVVHSVSFSPAQAVYSPLTEGYASAPIIEMAVTNTGNEAFAILLPEAQSYLLGPLSTTVLAVGESASFTVQPKLGLGVGTYEELISVYEAEPVFDRSLFASGVGFSIFDAENQLAEAEDSQQVLGTFSASFAVTKAPVPAPDDPVNPKPTASGDNLAATGDQPLLPLLVGMLALAGLALVGSAALKKKRQIQR